MIAATSEVSGDGSPGHTDDERDKRRERTDKKRDPTSEECAGEYVAAKNVGAEPVARTRGLKTVAFALAVGVEMERNERLN